MADLTAFSLAACRRGGDADLTFDFVRDLSEDEAAKLGAALGRLTRFSADQSLYIITELNWAELENALSQYQLNYHKFATSYANVESMLADVARHILNYLTSFRMFLDYSETALKREYGDQSDEYRHFKQATVEQYDGVFAYRFLSRFRNYAQHVGLPIDSMSRSDEVDGPGSPLQVFVSRARLLANKSIWSAQLISEIEGLPDKVAIVHYLEQLRPCLDVLRRAYYQGRIGVLRTAAQELSSVIDEVARAVEGPHYAVFARAVPHGHESGATTLQLTQIPYHALYAALSL